jgi:hypothetical protein
MRLISAGSLVRAQSGPVFARIVEESEDCRAVAGAKADRVELVDVNVASGLGKPSASVPFRLLNRYRAQQKDNGESRYLPRTSN